MVDGVIRAKLGQPLLRPQPFAELALLDFGLLLMTPPYPPQVLAPLRRRAGFQRRLALSKRPTRPLTSGFQLVDFSRLP